MLQCTFIDSIPPVFVLRSITPNPKTCVMKNPTSIRTRIEYSHLSNIDSHAPKTKGKRRKRDISDNASH